jgi:hypothetical protein
MHAEDMYLKNLKSLLSKNQQKDLFVNTFLTVVLYFTVLTSCKSEFVFSIYKKIIGRIQFEPLSTNLKIFIPDKGEKMLLKKL